MASTAFLAIVLCLVALGQAAPQIKYKAIHLDRSHETVPKAPVLDGPKERKIVEVAKRTTIDEDQEKLFKEQAANAKYSFDTYVEDGIMDHAHSRTETRNGLKVEGMYSYSDGFFKRTIQYEADEKGYRVLNEEVEPIGDGPIIDTKNGAAIVRTSLGTDYKITADDIRVPEDEN